MRLARGSTGSPIPARIPSVFRKILIANRGEIALRVLRACRELGVPSLSIFSEADRRAPHVLAADETACIGPALAYLDIPAVLEAGRKAGCDAVHPGYGFLSENPAFAEAAAKAGLTFIGPPAEVMRRMNDKLGARRLMHEAGLPVTPGSLEATEDPDRLVADARAAGFPVMLKAAKGGGGRGIRAVDNEKALREAVPSSASEALKAFGNGTLYIEKRISPARHVEVQVFGDAQGRVLHLGERECSLQRRHQKVLEETPSPALDAKTREALCAAAVRGARALGYRNAGTMEFLLDAQGRFFFMELNQRLQVEHPVTELVTGVDLVRAQILAAAGEDSGLRQEDLRSRGHAIEVRLCAEDAEAGFLPATGTVRDLALPGGPGIRIDGILREGLEVTMHYDSLLAKLCAWAPTRAEAVRRLGAALAETRIGGLRTNAAWLKALTAHPPFVEGRYDTGTLDAFRMPTPTPAEEEAAAVAAALAEHARRLQPLLPAQPAASAWRGAPARRLRKASW